MSSCPTCHKKIDIQSQHMGALYNCPHCKAIFFVGWDGQPEVAEPHSSLGNELESSPLDMNLSLETSEDPPADLLFQSLPDPEGEVIASMNAESPIEEALSSSPPPNPTPGGQDEGLMGDVLAFANQDESVGPLSYTLRIEGLELAETFERLREALSDSRFQWDVSEIMGSVRAGRLEISGVNPTKASILVNRIKSLPIEVSWSQEIYGGTS